MERLERLLVHIEEALRLARQDDEPHLRRALLLLGSAAELILHRAVEGKLTLQHLEGQLLAALDSAEAQGVNLTEEDCARQAALRQKVLSKTQRQKHGAKFDATAEYFAARGDLPVATARALRKAHGYRNEADHRDKVRTGSLRSAVDIYSYLVCTMLRDLNTTGVMVQLDAPPGLRPYLGSEGTGQDAVGAPAHEQGPCVVGGDVSAGVAIGVSVAGRGLLKMTVRRRLYDPGERAAAGGSGDRDGTPRQLRLAPGTGASASARMTRPRVR